MKLGIITTAKCSPAQVKKNSHIQRHSSGCGAVLIIPFEFTHGFMFFDDGTAIRYSRGESLTPCLGGLHMVKPTSPLIPPGKAFTAFDSCDEASLVNTFETLIAAWELVTGSGRFCVDHFEGITGAILQEVYEHADVRA